MASGKPETITRQLFEKVAQLFISSEPVSDFAVAQMKREAEKLQGVDAVEASIVKSGIAAFLWNADEANYWVRNAISLRESTVNYHNASVTMRALNDFEAARDYSLASYRCAPNSADTASKAISTLMMSGNFSDALAIAIPHVGSMSEIAEVAEEIESLQQAMGAIGITEDRIKKEMQAAFKVAANRKVRVKTVGHNIVSDPDGGLGIYIPIVFIGDFSTENALEDDFASILVDDPEWDPVKLSIEFTHQ